MFVFPHTEYFKLLIMFTFNTINALLISITIILNNLAYQINEALRTMKGGGLVCICWYGKPQLLNEKNIKKYIV